MWGVGKELVEEQGVTGLPRESRQITAEPQTCGEENALALGLAYLTHYTPVVSLPALFLLALS